MTVLNGMNRLSPRQLLFDWRASDRSLVARTGQVGTFTRASVGSVVDEYGILCSSVANNVPRFGYDAAGNFGLLLEGPRTNDLTFPRTLSNAAWTATSCTVAATTGADGIIGSASRLTATAANATVIRAAALVHAAQARAGSLRIRRIVGVGAVQVTLDGGATWTAIPVTASFAWQSVAQTLANSQFGIRLVTNGDVVDIDVTQNEAGAYPTSFIAGSRSADAFTFPFNAAAVRLGVVGITMYDDLTAFRPADADAVYSDVLILGGTTFGAANALTIQSTHLADLGTCTILADLTVGGVGSFPTVNVPYNAGDRLERMVTVSPTGVVTLTVSKNGGASVTAASAPGSWPAAFTAQTIALADSNTAQVGAMLRRSVRVAWGVQSLAQMQQLDLN